MSGAVDVWSGMLGLNGADISFDIAAQITTGGLLLLALSVAVAALEPRLNALGHRLYFPTQNVFPASTGPAGGEVAMPLTAATSLVPVTVLGSILLISVMKLAEQSFSPFLYFQF
jgi:alginate O-acetyltransferase complex protein AlgI